MMITPMSPIEDLHLSARAEGAIRYNFSEIRTVGQLATWARPSDLLRCPNFGKKSLREIEERLAECGLRLGHHPVVGFFPVVSEPGPWFAFCL